MKLLKILSISFLIVLTACTNEDKLENHIPDNSIFLMKVNTPSMIKKVAWDAFFSQNLFDLFDKDKKAGKSMKKMSKSGLDLTHEMYLLKTPDYFNEEFSILLKLDKQAELKHLLSEENIETKESNGITRARIDNGVFLSFSEKTALVTVTDRVEFLNELERQILSNTYTISEKMLMDVINSNHDIVSTSDYSEVLKTQMATLTYDKNAFDVSVFEDDYIFGYIDFLDGEVISDYTYFSGKKSAEFMKSITKENEVTKLVAACSGEKPLMLMSASFNFTGLVDFMKQSGIMTDIDKKSQLLKLYGTSADEILSFIKGDFLVYLEKVEEKEVVKTAYRFNEALGSMEPYIDTVNQVSPVFAISHTINKQERLNELIGSFRTMLEEKDGYISMKGGGDTHIRINEGVLTFTNSEDLMKEMVAGSSLKLSENNMTHLANKSYLVDMSTDPLLDAAKRLLPDAAEPFTMIQEVLEGLNSSGGMSPEGFNYNTVVKLKNKEDNSLFQIFELAKKIKETQEL